jgi:uncharacterized membrane protein YfcA
MDLYLVVGLFSIICGFLSGMLGIGGGIIMAPLLLYGLPMFGLAPMSMKVIAGLTIVQALLACLSGAIIHRKFHFVCRDLALWMGTTIFITGLVGGAASEFVSNTLLLAIFALLAALASILIFVPTGTDCEQPDITNFSFSRGRSVLSAGTVGIFGGLVGQGGSFILIPLMTSFMQVPTRIAVGSNLAIVFLSSFAAFLGKAVTGQIAWSLTMPLVISVIPATYLGSFVSRKVSVAGLRILLAIFIALAALRIGASAAGI